MMPPPRDSGDAFERLDPALLEFDDKERDLARQTLLLVERVRRGAGADKDKAAGELKAAVAKHFAVRQERRELEIKRIAEQLEKLKASVRKRQAEQEAIVARRVKELLSEDDTGF